MSKRGQNEGTIYEDKKRGGFRVMVSLPNGKRKTVRVKTREEAIVEKTKLLREVQTGMVPTGPRQTVAAYLEHWLENVAPATTKVHTQDGYAGLLRKHVIPHIGKKNLDKLSGQDLQALYRTLGKDKEEGGAGLSASSIRQIHRILHRALRSAIRQGIITRNVTEMIDPPRAVKPETRFYDSKTVIRFLEAIKGHPFEALLTTAVMTGLRQGELFALKWEDVNLEARTLSVRRTVYNRPGHGWVWSEPKSKASNRRVELEDSVVVILRRHKARQAIERVLAGDCWEDNGLVFPNSVGRPISAKNFTSRQFHPLLEAAGLPQIRFHDLRHTFASLLLADNVNPKIVQEALGHEKIDTTLGIYSHTTPRLHREAIDRLGRLLKAG